jgi:hypothetical protein
MAEKNKTLPIIKNLYAPINFYGKTFIVQTICKEDLTRYLSKKEIKKLTDSDMSYIAEKLGDAMQECYWDCLVVVLENFQAK